MSTHTITRYFAYAGFIISVFGIALGVANDNPAFVLSNIALAEVAIIALTIQLDSKGPRR